MWDHPIAPDRLPNRIQGRFHTHLAHQWSGFRSTGRVGNFLSLTSLFIPIVHSSRWFEHRFWRTASRFVFGHITGALPSKPIALSHQITLKFPVLSGRKGTGASIGFPVIRRDKKPVFYLRKQSSPPVSVRRSPPPFPKNRSEM